MKLTISPTHYARIAHQHNRVAVTFKALGKDKDAEYHSHKRDVTIRRARSVREQVNAKLQDTSR